MIGRFPLFLCIGAALITLPLSLPAREAGKPSRHPVHIDVSPVPNYRGQFVSIGALGNWRKPAIRSVLMFGGAVQATKPEVEANCSQEAIVYYALRAPDNFAFQKDGMLYGIRSHTPETRVDDYPGHNSCALVVHAILKKAGCKWAEFSANAKAVYDMAYRKGWRPAKEQKAGCLVAWNSLAPGNKPRIGRGAHYDPKKRGGVFYRHLGITTGDWMAMDNTAFFSQPTEFITTRPFRYEAPLFLCPPDKRPANGQGKTRKEAKDLESKAVKRSQRKRR